MDADLALQSEPPFLPLLKWTLPAGTFILGRSSGCDLVVQDATISRRHAEITVRKGSVTVRDLASRNGTFVNHQRVTTSRVQPGQQLRFGRVSFILKESSSTNADLESGSETGSCRESAPAIDGGTVEFSRAQRRVLNLLLDGRAEKEIARRLHLSPHTVHNHIQAIYSILQVHSRPELLARLLHRTAAIGPGSS